MTEIPELADFVVSTILDEEFCAVKEIFSMTETIDRNGRTYYYGYVETNIEEPKQYFVVLRKIWDRGNISASTAVSQIVQDWKPKFILIVGIGGGVSGQEGLELGDVVVSKEIEYNEMKKEIPGEILERNLVEDVPSPILVATHEKIKNNNWWKNITTKQPVDDSKQPKIVFGKIVSSEKLRGDPNSPELKEILSKNDKVIAVDMESGGFAISLYQNRASFDFLGYIVIRGISDFCNVEKNQETRETWKNYAASAAAAFAFELVKNAKNPAVQPVLIPYVNELKQKLQPEPETKFNLTFSPKNNDVRKPIEELINFVTSHRRVVLHGSAGGGKSSAITKISRLLINISATPIILNLKNWKVEYSQELQENNDTNSKMNVLLKTSTSTVNIESLEKLGIKWIIVDGLNEVAAGKDGEKTVREIIGTVDNYVQESYPNSFALITDRSSEREFLSSWESVKLNSIVEEEVCEIINNKFGESSFEGLSPSDKAVLQVPFFLNIVLSRKLLIFGTEAKILEDFFKDRIHLDDDQINKLSSCVFYLSKQSLQLAFDKNEFKKCTEETLFGLLENSGEIKSDDGNIGFEHQLKRDYLISRYLALHENEWNWKSFDIASLEYNSIESIIMTLEQLTEPQKADTFLLEIHDWNWPTAINSLSRMDAKETKYHSNEIKISMLASLAQKMFDPVYGTSESAKKFMESFESMEGKQLVNANSLSDVISIVNENSFSNGWYEKWKQLFTRDREKQLSEDEIALITEKTSLLGWTAANVLKECELTDQQQSQLRILYKSNNKDEPTDNTIRWRVIHTLGQFDSQENGDLLLNAIDNDLYHWAVYGSVRSVVEMAAITKNDELRNYLIKSLKEKLPKLRAREIEEIGRVVCYRNCPETWKEDVKSLLDECGKQEIVNKKNWKKRIEFFEGEEWKSN